MDRTPSHQTCKIVELLTNNTPDFIRGHRYKLFKKRKGTLGKTFFTARVVDLQNELDDSTVSVDNGTAFKRKLGKLGY